MEQRPPKRLPKEYLEIWRALHGAVEQGFSRQELARRLGLSTYTLQRLLVDGTVPRLARTKSTRVRRSWTRIVARPRA